MPRLAVETAVKRGHLEILRWLRDNRCDINWKSGSILEAVDGSHLDVAKWLYSVTGYEAGSWIIPAAKSGNLDMVRWVVGFKKTSLSKKRQALEVAADHGHIGIVKWLLNHTELNSQRVNLSGLLKPGSIDTVDVVLKHQGNVCPRTWVRALENAIATGQQAWVEHLLALEFIAEYFQDLSYPLEHAAYNGHLGILIWLESRGVATFTSTIMNSAALGGNLDILQWLHEKSCTGCTESGVTGAAQNGHLAVLQWLNDHNSMGFTTAAMDSAAANNHLEVVKWLHKNRREGCTTRAMDHAAAGGHLDMVKWIHNNRSEGCTVNAMDFAAGGGHLDVVKWLHNNRSEGCTVDAMNNAASRSLHVVKWLHENRTEGCTVNAMENAATAGNFDIVLFLHRERSEGCVSMALNSVWVSRQWREFIPWFEANYPTQFTDAELIDEEEEMRLLALGRQYLDELVSRKFED